MQQQDGISALRRNTYAGNHPCAIGLSGSNQWYLGPEVQWLALTAVVVRMDSLFWADSTLMKRRMSSCMVMPWSVVYRVIWVAMLSAAVYMSAMLFRPVTTSGRVHLPAPPGISAQVLGADTTDRRTDFLVVLQTLCSL